MVRISPWRLPVLALAAALPMLPAEAQQGPQRPFGFWGEVVSASDKWLVVANDRGQQFPIAMNDSVGQFLVRWPTSPDRLSPDFLVEASGLGGDNNTIVTEHVDVFRGRAQALVGETVQPLVEARPLFDPMNVMMMNIFGPVYILPPAAAVQPRTLHVVGFWAGSFPLRIVQGGNVMFQVAANSMTEVTAGSPSFVEPGDTVFCFARGYNGKSLLVEQLIVYKSIPIDQFAAP